MLWLECSHAQDPYGVDSYDPSVGPTGHNFSFPPYPASMFLEQLQFLWTAACSSYWKGYTLFNRNCSCL